MTHGDALTSTFGGRRRRSGDGDEGEDEEARAGTASAAAEEALALVSGVRVDPGTGDTSMMLISSKVQAE